MKQTDKETLFAGLYSENKTRRHLAILSLKKQDRLIMTLVLELVKSPPGF